MSEALPSDLLVIALLARGDELSVEAADRIASLERELTEAADKAARAIMDGADRDDRLDVAVREGIVRSVRRSLSTAPTGEKTNG